MLKLTIKVIVAMVCANAFAQASTGLLPNNFAKVSPGIYRGGRPSPENLKVLREMGIKVDISLQGGDLDNPHFRKFIALWEPGESPQSVDDEMTAANDLKLQFVNIPFDSLDPVTTAEDHAIDLLLERLNRASEAIPIYLHCEHGRDRTGLIIALYRIQHDHWSAQAAFSEWKKFGHKELSRLVEHNLDSYFAKKAKMLAILGSD